MKQLKKSLARLMAWTLYGGFVLWERLFLGAGAALLVGGGLALVLPEIMALMIGLIVFLAVGLTPVWPPGGRYQGGHLYRLLWLSPGLGAWVLGHVQPRKQVQTTLLARRIACNKRMAQHPDLAAWALRVLMPQKGDGASWSPANRQALEQIAANLPGSTRQRIANQLKQHQVGDGWLKRWLRQQNWSPTDLLTLTTHPDPEIRKLVLRKLGRSS